MSYFGSTEYLTEVARGNVDGESLVHVLGRNDNVGTMIRDINMNNVLFTFLTAASTLNAISDNPNDTIAGGGARVIKIEGLDANFDLVEDVLDMNGTSNTLATSVSFIRVNKVLVTETGTYASTLAGSNLGNITVNTTGGGSSVQGFIDGNQIDPGLSQDAKYCIPNAHTAIIVGAGMNVESNKAARLMLNVRAEADDVSVPFIPRRSGGLIDGLTGFHSLEQSILNIKLEAKTDVWGSAVATAMNTQVGAAITLLLIKD